LRRLIPITFGLLLLAVPAIAQIRGTGRLQGNVFDKSSGKGVAGATVTISLPGGGTRPIVTKTDSRGHWAAIGMTSGEWNIDITAPGYQPSRGTASVSEVSTPPALRIELTPEVKEEVPASEITPANTISKEAVALIKEGQDLLRMETGDAKENAKNAVAAFEKVLPMIAEDTPELRDVKNQVMNVLAQAYYRAGDTKNAIATLEKLRTADPAGATPDAAHTTRDVLLANLYLENGQLDQGKALLEKLPATAITEPTAYINIGILFLNKKNPSDAVTYFTKAIQLDAKRADSYYYRALAELQLKKNADAKADLQQVLTLSPDSSEAKDAKQLLASMK
jgi:Tfp pilus assembly protein PilF